MLGGVFQLNQGKLKRWGVFARLLTSSHRFVRKVVRIGDSRASCRVSPTLYFLSIEGQSSRVRSIRNLHRNAGNDGGFPTALRSPQSHCGHRPVQAVHCVRKGGSLGQGNSDGAKKDV